MRLTDYIEFKDFHYNCPFEYYKTALSKYNLDEYQIFLFSDDIKLANEKLESLNLNIINANELFENDEDQFYMLALSNVRVCANSSFSLMTCYFNEIFNFVDDCEYIFPEKWFGPKGPDYNIYDLIPNDNYKFKVFNLTTADGGTTWYANEEVNNNNPQPYTMFVAGNNAAGIKLEWYFVDFFVSHPNSKHFIYFF